MSDANDGHALWVLEEAGLAQVDIGIPNGPTQIRGVGDSPNLLQWSKGDVLSVT